MVKAWERWKPGDSMEQSRRPTFHGDVLDGKAEDDGPDHSQGHLRVAVHNLCTQGKAQRVRSLLEPEGDSPGGPRPCLEFNSVI